MNAHRLVWMTAALAAFLVLTGSGCGRESVAGIPDGVYRDADGLATLALQGSRVTLQTTLMGGKLMVVGTPVLYPDGRFSISDIAANQFHAIFHQRLWTWEKDHFVIKETAPPHRTLELRRQ